MHAAPRAVQNSLCNSALSAKFTPAQRLLREDSFNHVVHAEHITDKYFKIFFVRNHEKNTRLGIIASKKILPNAVDRNRAKRIIRETFRQHNVKVAKLDIVVMVRRAYAQEPRTRADDLKTLFSRVENRCA